MLETKKGLKTQEQEKIDVTILKTVKQEKQIANRGSEEI